MGENSSFALSISTKIIIIGIVRIANVRNHFDNNMHIFAFCFPDINYDVSDEQINNSACDLLPTYFEHQVIIGVDGWR